MEKHGFLSTGLAVGLGLCGVVGLAVVVFIKIMVTIVELFITVTTLTAL
ncbi:hypothetical protein [Ectobacillus funiculus]|uniref:Uncharacterized protein n=1 Tax=Ectobacillus funiculus TaxID=137993 RepID=A0ABV5WPG3_9BACI